MQTTSKELQLLYINKEKKIQEKERNQNTIERSR